MVLDVGAKQGRILDHCPCANYGHQRRTKKINGNVYDKTVALLPQSPGKIEAYIVGVPGVYLLIVSSVTSRSGQDVDSGQVPLLCLTSGGGGALHLSMLELEL